MKNPNDEDVDKWGSWAQVIHILARSMGSPLPAAGPRARCAIVEHVKRTYQPKARRRQRVHGFRARMRTPGGRNVLKRRKAKGRHRVAI